MQIVLFYVLDLQNNLLFSLDYPIFSLLTANNYKYNKKIILKKKERNIVKIKKLIIKKIIPNSRKYINIFILKNLIKS